jgi:hypothetical protein
MYALQLQKLGDRTGSCTFNRGTPALWPSCSAASERVFRKESYVGRWRIDRSIEFELEALTGSLLITMCLEREVHKLPGSGAKLPA